MSRPVLYDYYRSSAAYRVRIALNLKGVDYEQRPVNLAESAQRSDDYRALNPQGLVPALELDDGSLGQLMTSQPVLATILRAGLPLHPATATAIR